MGARAGRGRRGAARRRIAPRPQARKTSRAAASRSCPRAGGSSASCSVEENLRLGLAGRRSQSGAADGVERVYELFPIVREFRGRAAGALSGGQQQQLAIARALVARARCPAARRAVARARAADRRRRLRRARRDSRDAASPCCSSSSARSAPSRSPTAAHVLANGELRLTLGRDDAADTEKLVAAYFS